MPDGKYNDGETQQPRAVPGPPGIVYREQGKTDEAVATYKQMVQLGRRLRAARRGWRGGHAIAMRTSGLQRLRRPLRLRRRMPKNHEVQLIYARQLADAGKLDEAIEARGEAAERNAGRPRSVLHRSPTSKSRAKRWKEASAQLDKAEALATKPEDKVFLYFYRGTVAEQQKLYDQAEAEFRKGLAIDPENAADRERSWLHACGPRREAGRSGRRC